MGSAIGKANESVARQPEATSKIQTVMIQKQDYGTASAMTWVYFVVVIAFVGITSLAISKGVYYSD